MANRTVRWTIVFLVYFRSRIDDVYGFVSSCSIGFIRGSVDFILDLYLRPILQRGDFLETGRYG